MTQHCNSVEEHFVVRSASSECAVEKFVRSSVVVGGRLCWSATRAGGSRARFADYAEPRAERAGAAGRCARTLNAHRPAPHTRNLFISSYVKFTRNNRYCI